MQYPDIKEYITFLFSMLDEFSATQEKIPKKGDPRPIPMLHSSFFTPL